jgi:calcium binding protein 39
MSFLFKKKALAPADLIKNTKDAILKLQEKNQESTNVEISKYLVNIKNILYGDNGLKQESNLNPETTYIAIEIVNSDILLLLVSNLHLFEFEAKKDVVLIFNNLLRRQIGTRYPIVDYISSKKEIIPKLVAGYGNQEISLNCGMILREALRHVSLAMILLESDEFWDFFIFAESATFDLSSDSFATFKESLTKHKQIVAKFLDTNFDKFFSKYMLLWDSENYVTKRQSIKVFKYNLAAGRAIG